MLPVVIWALGLVLLSRFAPATAIRVTDNSSATAAMRRSWTLTRTARLHTAAIHLLSTAAVAGAFTVLRWLGTYVAHWAGLLMLATTGGNVWVTGVLVIITPTAVALVLLPWCSRRWASYSRACASGSAAAREELWWSASTPTSCHRKAAEAAVTDS